MTFNKKKKEENGTDTDLPIMGEFDISAEWSPDQFVVIPPALWAFAGATAL